MLKCNTKFDLRLHQGSMRQNVNCCKFESYFTSPMFLFVLLNLSCSFLKIGNSFLLIIILGLCWIFIVHVAACGFSCPASCGSLVPPARIEPMSQHWKVDSQPLDHQGSPWSKLRIVLCCVKVTQSCRLYATP